MCWTCAVIWGVGIALSVAFWAAIIVAVVS